MTFADGNLALSGYTASTSAYGTFGLSSGKWFWQIVAQANAMAGIAATPNGSQYPGQASDSYAMDLTNGTKYNNGSSATYGSGEITAGNVIGVGFDADAGTLKFYDSDGNDIGTAYSSLTSGPYYPVFRNGNSANISINFGQTGAFTFTPSGYNSLTVLNFADPAIADPGDHFNTVLYTGNGTTGQSITGVGFQPDWVWTKIRSPNAYSHQLFDAVRGAGKNLQSNNTNAEGDLTSEFISFDSNGFTIDDVNQNVNENSSTYVSWNWKANGSGASNEDGSINTTATSANTTAGFSISTFTGNQTSGATFGHGLGVAPKMVIVKERSPAGNNWKVGHDAMGWGKYIALDTNAAQVTDSAHWNDTAPSSTVVTLGNDTGINQNTATYVAYCFAEVEGYSKISSYVGNGNADGPYVNCGFKPAWVIGKRIGGSGGYFDWWLFDSKRPGFNVTNERIHPNNSQGTDTGAGSLDLVSNGFKIRTNTSSMNSSGDTIIFMAFAESPFKTATAR